MSLEKIIEVSGIWLYLTLIPGLMMVVYVIYLGTRLYKKHNVIYEKKDSYLRPILILGSLSLVMGILSQVLGIYEVLGAIAEAGDISPSMVMEGLRVSFITPICGMIVMVISYLSWLILRYYA